jgi:hypothetical protein
MVSVLGDQAAQLTKELTSDQPESVTFTVLVLFLTSIFSCNINSPTFF